MAVSTRTRWFIRGCALVAFLASSVHTFQSLVWVKVAAFSPILPPFLLLGVLAALAGIAAQYAFVQRDSDGYRKLGVVFALMGLAGIPLLLLLGAMTEVWGPPAEQESTFLRSLGLLVDSPVMPLSALAAAGGLLVLGGVILASGVGLPRWCGPLIMLANPPVVSFLYLVLLFFVGELFVAVGIV